MVVAIRGTTPATTSGTGDPISVSLTGARQPNTGDVLLIVHANNFYDLSNMATPTVGGSSTGVTAITNGTADGGTGAAHAKSYTYVVGSTGDLAVAVDETGTADEDKLLVAYVLSGVDTTTPVDVAGSTYVGTGEDPHIAPSVSPTSGDAFLVCHVGAAADTSPYTPPGTMTETYDFNVGPFCSGTGAVQQLSASGATGTRSFDAAFSNTYLALTIAVKTATGPPPPVPKLPQVVQGLPLN